MFFLRRFAQRVLALYMRVLYVLLCMFSKSLSLYIEDLRDVEN